MVDHASLVLCRPRHDATLDPRRADAVHAGHPGVHLLPSPPRLPWVPCALIITPAAPPAPPGAGVSPRAASLFCPALPAAGVRGGAAPPGTRRRRPRQKEW